MKTCRDLLGTGMVLVACTLGFVAAKAQQPPVATQPPTLTVCHQADKRDSCATWTFNKTQGTGIWPSGEIASLEVKSWDPKTSKIVVERWDSAGKTPNLHGLYTGALSKGRFEGTYQLDLPDRRQVSGAWTGTMVKAGRPEGWPEVLHFRGPSYEAELKWNTDHYEANSYKDPRGNPAREIAATTYKVLRFADDAVTLERTQRTSDGQVGKAFLDGKRIGNRVIQGEIVWEKGDTFFFNLGWGDSFNDIPWPPSTPKGRPPVEGWSNLVVLPVIPVFTPVVIVSGFCGFFGCVF